MAEKSFDEMYGKKNYEVYDRITGFLYVRFIQKMFLKRTHMHERVQAS